MDDPVLTLLAVLMLLCLTTACAVADEPGAEDNAFTAANEREWQEAFFDPCTEDWTKRWFLDGRVASVRNSQEGMQMTSGPRAFNDAHHMVLWTKDSFEGDVKIEYEYTRLDFETSFVNILYIQATGSGQGRFATDITEWSVHRETPAMRMYFDHMHLYHISYAAFGNTDSEVTDYIRARRYMPHATGLKGTELTPDYTDTGLFAPGVPHKITVIKSDRALLMRVENAEQTRTFHFKNENLPAITEGRIGLRQMFARSSRYKNFRVSVPAE
ncbi:MAG: DUF1961 family protein [Planctomycetota bacterium]